MESYEQMLSRAYSTQMSQAQLSRRRSQRTMPRPQPLSSRPTRVEKPSSRHTSPNSLLQRRRAGSSTLSQEQEAQYTQAISRSMARADLTRLERPLSWHSSSTAQILTPSYYHPATMQTTPSGMGKSSYDWPEDVNDWNIRSTQSTSSCHNDTTSYGGNPASNQNDDFFSQPLWLNANFGTAATHPLAQINFPYQPYATTQNSQSMQTTMPYSDNTVSWQEQEVPGLEEDASPSTETSPDANSGEELVGLGLYDKTVRTSTGLLGLGVKSLKLTEGWTPPAEQVHALSSQNSSYSTPYDHHEKLPLEQNKQSNISTQQAYPYDFSDHSFLFDNSTYGTEWFDVQQTM